MFQIIYFGAVTKKNSCSLEALDECSLTNGHHEDGLVQVPVCLPSSSANFYYILPRYWSP